MIDLIIYFFVVVLKVLVDKRMRLSTLKKDLESLVGVPVEYFKVFRLSNSGEVECSCLTEQLNTYEDGERLNVKLGRALRNGEFKVKLYQLLIDSTEVCIIIFYFSIFFSFFAYIRSFICYIRCIYIIVLSRFFIMD